MKKTFRQQFVNDAIFSLCNVVLIFFVASYFHGSATSVLAAGNAPSTITIISDIPDPSAIGQDVAVSVTVTGEYGTPTGTVDISGAHTNCSFTLADGSGSCNVNFVHTGKKTLSATYSGDSTYAANFDTETHALPTLVVSQKRNFVSVYDWPMGASISLDIDDPAFVPPAPIIVDESIENIFLEINDEPGIQPGDFDIKPGQTIRVTDGTTTLEHTVGSIQITQVNPGNDTISGIADIGSEIVFLFLSEGSSGNSCNRVTTTESDGTWIVDVSHAGVGETICNIRTGSYGEIRQEDINDFGTMEDWNVGAFVVSSEGDFVSLYDWPTGANINIAIDDPAFVPPASIIVDESIENIFLDFDIKPGQTVSVTDGITILEHRVGSVKITQVNPINDTISGTADIGSEIVFLFLSDANPDYVCNRITTTNPDSTWQVSVAGVCDIKSGSYGEIRQEDINDFGTLDDWSVGSNPTITARFYNSIQGRDWPLGMPITVTVDNPATAEPVDYRATSTIPEFDLSNFQLEPGFIVTMTDGATTKSMSMIDHSITSVNVLDSTVKGITDSSLPMAVRVRCGRDPTWYPRYITPIPNTEWSVNFSEAGSLPEEQVIPLDYSCRVNISQTYPDGNTSSYRWPYDAGSQADPMNDLVSAERWPLGTYLTLAIDDPDTSSIPVDYTTGPVVIGIHEEYKITFLQFDLGDYDLQTGDVITIHAGPDSGHPDVYQLTYTVDPLKITSVNFDEDTIRGIAPHDAEVMVLATNDGFDFHTEGIRYTTADKNGNWMVDFFHAGSGGSSEEQIRINITPTSGVGVDINDHTEVSWPSQKLRAINETGGFIFTENVNMQVPAGALSTSVDFTVVEGGNGFQITTTNQVVLDTAASVTIGPEGTTFELPITITLTWPDIDNDGIVDGTSTNEVDIYVSKNGDVLAGPCSGDSNCNTTLNTYSVQVSSLSYFVLGSPATNHAPFLNSATFSVSDNAENGTSVGTATYTDADTGQNHACTIIDGNMENAFTINETTCEITVNDASKIDYSSRPSYALEVRVTDNGSPVRHGDATITINVNSVNDPPTVKSITCVNPNPTYLTSVDFTVTFSEFVTGMDVDDFKLTNTLLTGASITEVNGSGDTYTVTVSTGTGNGTIRLDVRGTASIEDLTGSAFVDPYTGGETYTVNKGTAPTVPVLKSPSNNAVVTSLTPTLNWGDSSEVLTLAVPGWHYEINVTSPYGYNETFNTVDDADPLIGLGASQYTFTTTLPESTTFTWKVRAYNGQNQYSAWSASRTFRTPPAVVLTKLPAPVLTLPANTTSPTLNNTRPTFTWEAVSGATSYTLQILSSGKVVNSGTIKAPLHSYAPTKDLLPDTVYTWQVKANGKVSGDYSTPFTFKTSANPPAVPVLVSPANKALVDAAVQQTLKWKLASGSAASYEVEYATDAAFFDSETGIISGTELSLAAGSLLPNHTYYWHVRSWSEADAKGNHSYWSAVRTFRTKLPTPVLNLPTNGTTLDSIRPTFTWDEVPGTTTYTLQVLKDGKVVVTGNIKAPAYVYTSVKDLLPGTTYTWKVKANGTNAGDYSAPFTFTTSANPPKAPILSAPANNVLVDSTATQTLKWNPVLAAVSPAAASYEVEYATNAGFINSSPTVKVNAPTTETSPITLLPGRTYYWHVRSWSGADTTGNHSAWSLARTIKVKFVAPTLTSPVADATNVSVRPTFTWSSANGLWTFYTLQIAPDNTFGKGTRTIKVNAPTTKYTIPDSQPALSTGVQYCWRVKINGLYFPVLSATVNCFTTAP